MDLTQYVDPSPLEKCINREKRCANALKVDTIDLSIYNPDPESHAIVTKDCTFCTRWRDCPHPKPSFNSTHNSRRRTHLYLWWKTKLGPGFPITHSMLDREVVRTLQGCEYGLKGGNLHPMVKGLVCINPYHYTAGEHWVVLKYLLEALNDLGLNKHPAIKNEMFMAEVNEHKEDAFDSICNVVRRVLSGDVIGAAYTVAQVPAELFMEPLPVFDTIPSWEL